MDIWGGGIRTDCGGDGYVSMILGLGISELPGMMCKKFPKNPADGRWDGVLEERKRVWREEKKMKEEEKRDMGCYKAQIPQVKGTAKQRERRARDCRKTSREKTGAHTDLVKMCAKAITSARNL